MIEIKNIVKSYGELKVLKGIDLTIKDLSSRAAHRKARMNSIASVIENTSVPFYALGVGGVRGGLF